MAEFSRSIAFVIGINDYQNGIPELQTAVNDAKKLEEILREQHGYHEVLVCLNKDATLKNLHSLLEKTLPQQVTPDDRLLFYFAGHGVALNGDDGPQGYLIPHSADVNYITDIFEKSNTNKFYQPNFLGLIFTFRSNKQT